MKSVLCATILAAMALHATPAFAQQDDQVPTIQITLPPQEAKQPRPQALAPLYVSLGALQVYDGYSTLRGTQGGAPETNPLVGGLAGKPAAFWAVKALSTGVSIVLAEQLWRQGHRKQAVVYMAIGNGIMAVVAARNASILARQP